MNVDPGGAHADAQAGRLSAASEDWAVVCDAVAHMFALLDERGALQRINAAGARLFGMRPDAMIGRCPWQGSLWPGNGAAALRAADLFAEAVATGRAQGDVGYRTDAGAAGILALSFLVVSAEGGSADRVVMEGREVTDQRRQEHELGIAHAKFAGMFEISADAVITIDEEQRILDFNAGAETIFGWTAAEVRGRALDLLIPERFRGAHAQHVRDFAASGVASRRMGERRAIEGLRKDGRTFPAEASISQLEVAGRNIGTVVLRDMTDRHRTLSAQRLLARAGALLAESLDEGDALERVAPLIVESVADACVVFAADASGTIRRVATAARTEANAASLAGLRGQPIAPHEAHPVHAVIASGEPVLLPRFGGTPFARDPMCGPAAGLIDRLPVRSALFTPLPIRGEVRGAIGLYFEEEAGFGVDEVSLAAELASRVGMAVDNARLYREAVEAVRARDEVLAVVSHDLGNPLSAIRIGVMLLLRNRPLDAAADGGWGHLAGIQQSVEQMERLIRDLLDVKRIEAGHLSLALEEHEAGTLLADAAELMAPLADGRGQRISVAVKERPTVVQADRERVMQVLANLLGNAVKFTQTGGSIELTAVGSGGEVVFSVRDDGPGIPEADLENIFDRFWQVQRKGREGLGLGLGLAIVRGIVEAHGGRVWAESELGEGTTISFTLPAAEPSASRHD